jgi:hypothetical protein
MATDVAKPAAARPIAPTAAAQARPVVPVKWWAGLGGLILAFEIYVLVRWITGPFFTTVPGGATPLPTFMKIGLIVMQVLSIPVALLVIYRVVVRPWRRDHHLGIDGLLVIAFSTMWFQDPLSAYAGHWFTYNTHLLNFGSWVSSVPGWMSFSRPGQMIAEPILLIPGVYVWVFLLTTLLGCRIMRATKARWPSVGPLGLAGACFVSMMAFDVVFEGII